MPRTFFNKILSFFKGSLCGVGADLILFQSLTRSGLAPLYANLISSAAAIITTYVLVSQKTFEQKLRLDLFIIFFSYYTFSVFLFSFLIQQAIMWTLWPPLFCKVLSLPFSFAINFLASHWLLSKRKKSP